MQNNSGKKIFMTLMGLEIGGAETHVVELCVALSKMGYDVSVASNGGVYEEELKKHGIPHYKIPLHNKNPINMIKSYLMLNKIIKRERFDIVHAHARIPAFICGLLHKKRKFRFVTTAHWVFHTNFLLTRLTNWGERTIAVSEDIKKYLMDTYDENPHKISVTINGIDTEKFSQNTDCSDLERELELEEGRRRIVYVSRMDTDRSAVAFMLIEALERLNDESLQAVIVGGGDDYTRLEAAAEEANKRAGRRLIVLTGARTDINKCVALGEMFVGVSRAALEAMAAGKPVIIAGNEGYIGIFDESTFEISQQTNFCCRGCEQSNVELLVRDIKKILESDKHKAGEFNRQVIINNYSVKRMAQDCIDAYEKVLKDKFLPRAVISGYYGFSNMGDDSLLSVIVGNLKKSVPNIKITVLSNNPKETKAIEHVGAVNRFNPFSLFRVMRKGGLFINGGGSLLQDVTSTQSLMYYLCVMRLAKMCGMQVLVYANGIGPITKAGNRRATRNVLKGATHITLRDKSSYEELLSLSLPEGNMKVTADPAYALEPVGAEVVDDIFKEEGLDDAAYFAVSVREWKRNCENFSEIIKELCDYIREKYNIQPLIIPMQYSRDLAISQGIQKLSKGEFKVLGRKYSAAELLGVVGRMKMVIGMRLHILIYAASQGVPVLGLSYDPKVNAALSEFELEYIHNVEKLDVEAMKRNVDEILENHEQISGKIKDAARKLKDKAMEDIEIATRFI